MQSYENRWWLFGREKYLSITLLATSGLLLFLVIFLNTELVQFNLFEYVYLFQGTYTIQLLQNFWSLLISIAPYFLSSVLISVVLIQHFSAKSKSLLSTSKIFPAILAGAFAGLLSPLPTYVAVPFGLSLRRSGAPLPAIIAFITASPLINPTIFYLTWSLLGLKIAIARVVSAFLIATLCGISIPHFVKDDQIRLLEKSTFTPKKRRPFSHELKRHSLFMGKLFVLSIFISSAVKTLVPADFIATLFNQFSNVGILVAIAMGAPLYNCGGAAIPIIQVLLDMGMGSGAALAFFISGPMTKPETFYIYKKTLGYKFFSIQVLIIFLSSFIFGLMYSWL